MAGRFRCRPRRRHGAEDPARRRLSAARGSTASSFMGYAPPLRAGSADSAPCSMRITTPTASLWCRKARPPRTPSDASSAYARKDADFATSFAVERQGPLNQAAGLRRQCFRRPGSASIRRISPISQHADGDQRAEAARTCSPRCGRRLSGYFLSQMMDPVFQPDQIETAGNTSPPTPSRAGAAPAFRVGTTPYGVLPVTSLTRYKPARPEPPFAAVEQALVALRLAALADLAGEFGRCAAHADAPATPTLH